MRTTGQRLSNEIGYSTSRMLEIPLSVLRRVRPVGRVEHRLQLEGKLRRLDLARELTQRLRLGYQIREQLTFVTSVDHDGVAHGSGPRMKFSRHDAEETAAWKLRRGQIVEDALAHSPQACDATRSAQRRLKHTGDITRPCGFDGSELQLLFRAEMGEQPALAQAQS